MKKFLKKILNEKIVPAIMKFINFRAILAIKDGLIYTMPLTIVGSVFLLLAQIPYEPLANYIAERGWDVPLFQAYNATFNLVAIIGVMGIAYAYVKLGGYEPMPAGIIALCTFVLTTNLFVVDEAGTVFSGVINMTWTGGQGLVSAILIGLFTGVVYSWFIKRDIRIKMPEGVPEGISSAFTALIPGFVIILAATIVFTIFDMFGTTMIETIYQVIQIPLQGATDSLGGVILIAFAIPFLWWFGVHGSTVVGGIMMGLLTANMTANQTLMAAGTALTVDNGGKIVTLQFLNNLLIMTGSGITIGIVLYMVILGKSRQSKELGRLAILPGIFNINEPILFATPIVMNPFMFIPFCVMPVLAGIVSYFAMYVGLVPMFSGVNVPWTTPPIIAGFLMGGWRMALLQAVILAMSFFVYLPFIRRIDRMNYEAEQGGSKEEKETKEEPKKEKQLV